MVPSSHFDTLCFGPKLPLNSNEYTLFFVGARAHARVRAHPHPQTHTHRQLVIIAGIPFGLDIGKVTSNNLPEN